MDTLPRGKGTGRTEQRDLDGPVPPRDARAWSTSVLAGWGRTHIAEDLQLVITELVTNALLHAAGPLRATLAELPDGGVRVEVEDQTPEKVPAVADSGLLDVLALDADVGSTMEELDAETFTGRGLLLVERIATQWGVTLRDDRKAVWADIAGRGETPAAVTPTAAPAVDEGPTGPVRLVGVPARIVLLSAANLDDAVREATVVARSEGGLDPALAEQVAVMVQRSSGVRDALVAAAKAAVEQGRRLVDVTIETPRATAAVLPAMNEALVVIADWCRRAELLSLPPTDEILAFREWYAEEIARQLAGAAPRACPFPAVPTDASPRPDESTGGPALERVAPYAAPLRTAASVHEIADVLVTATRELLGATNASLCLLADDGLTLRLIEPRGYSTDVVEFWGDFSVGDDLPASEVARSGRPMYLSTLAERDARFPVFTRTPTLTSIAFAVVPVGGRGVLVTGYSEERPFAPADRAVLGALADLVLSALDRLG